MSLHSIAMSDRLDTFHTAVAELKAEITPTSAGPKRPARRSDRFKNRRKPIKETATLPRNFRSKENKSFNVGDDDLIKGIETEFEASPASKVPSDDEEDRDIVKEILAAFSSRPSSPTSGSPSSTLNSLAPMSLGTRSFDQEIIITPTRVSVKPLEHEDDKDWGEFHEETSIANVHQSEPVYEEVDRFDGETETVTAVLKIKINRDEADSGGITIQSRTGDTDQSDPEEIKEILPIRRNQDSAETSNDSHYTVFCSLRPPSRTSALGSSSLGSQSSHAMAVTRNSDCIKAEEQIR